MVQSFEELFGNVQTQENSDGSSTFTIPGPINTRVELVKRKWILNRKYMDGPEHKFEFDTKEEAVDFVQEKQIMEMRYLLRGIGLKDVNLKVNFTTNIKGDFIWNISFPVSGVYRDTANFFCIFKLMEV